MKHINVLTVMWFVEMMAPSQKAYMRLLPPRGLTDSVSTLQVLLFSQYHAVLIVVGLLLG